MDLELLIQSSVKIGLLVGGILTAAAWLVLVERWMAAWIQMRRGPNRVGIPWMKSNRWYKRLLGLGQPMADGLKFIFKEEYTPAHVNRRLYILAPIVIMASALAIYAVIPFGSSIPPIFGADEPIPLIVAPKLDVGLIYVFALSSIAVYGVIFGGWASNNKYSFLGGLRSSAQIIAYELPLGMGILGVVLVSGTLQLEKIIVDQASSGVWNAFAQPLGLIVFVIASFAEAARLPFDLPEAEQELVGGYHTEYSGIKLLLFLTAEFIHMITAAFLITILFLGGWHFWGLTGDPGEISWVTAILRIVVMFTKILAVILFFMLVRWSWPRFRYDQLMNLGWKVMLPLGMLNVLVVAILVEIAMGTGVNYPAATWWFIAAAWITMIGGWLIVAVASPVITDNKPRLESMEF